MRIAGWLAGAMLLQIPGWSQVQIHSFNELTNYADKNSVVATKGKIQNEIAHLDKMIAISGLMPRISAFSTGDYYPIIPSQVIPTEFFGGPKDSYTKVQFGLPYVFSAGLGAEMPIISFDRWTQLKAAGVRQKRTELQSKLDEEKQHIQAAQLYYQLLAFREMSALNSQNSSMAGELVSVIDKRKESGIVNPSDYNRSKGLELDIRSAGISYSKNIAQLTSALEALCSIPEGQSMIIDDSLRAFSWPLPDRTANTSARTATKLSQEGVRVAETGLLESRLASLPKLSVSYKYAYNAQSKLTSGSGGVEYSYSIIGLRLDVPIFQGNYLRTQQAKNRQLLAAANVEKQMTSSMLNQQQNEWYTLYKASFEKRQVLEQKVSLASENLRIAKLSTEQGVMEFDEFNNIFMEYNRAKIEYIQNLADGILYYLLNTQNF